MASFHNPNFDVGGDFVPPLVEQLRLVGVLDPRGYLVAMRFQNPSGGPSTDVVAWTPGPNSLHVFTYQGARGGITEVSEMAELLSTSGQIAGVLLPVNEQRMMERDLPPGYRRVYLRWTVFDPQNPETGVPMALRPRNGGEAAMVVWPTDMPLMTGLLPHGHPVSGIRLIYMVDGTPEEEEEEEEPAAAQDEERVAGQVEEEAAEDDEDDEDYEPMSDE